MLATWLTLRPNKRKNKNTFALGWYQQSDKKGKKKKDFARLTVCDHQQQSVWSQPAAMLLSREEERIGQRRKWTKMTLTAPKTSFSVMSLYTLGILLHWHFFGIRVWLPSRLHLGSQHGLYAIVPWWLQPIHTAQHTHTTWLWSRTHRVVQTTQTNARCDKHDNGQLDWRWRRRMQQQFRCSRLSGGGSDLVWLWGDVGRAIQRNLILSNSL